MPDKSPDAFRTISEVADWLGVQPHVLRFWESKFSQVRPVKRAGGRRYYRPNDMLLLGGIRKLLHEDGLTIKGAQKVLREEGMSHVARLSRPLDAESAALSGMAVEFEEDGHDPDQDPPTQDREFDDVPPVPEDVPPESGPSPDEALAKEGSQEQPLVAHLESVPEKGSLPSFMRSTATRKPSEPAQPDLPNPRPAKPPTSDRLPSFLQPPESAEATEAELPLSFPAEPEDREPEPTPAPRPKAVDAPDPDESAFEVEPGTLSASFSAATMSPQRRADALPLVAQLAALRDRMAAGRDR